METYPTLEDLARSYAESVNRLDESLNALKELKEELGIEITATAIKGEIEEREIRTKNYTFFFKKETMVT